MIRRPRRALRFKNPTAIDAAVSAYKDGDSAAKAGEAFGVSSTSVLKYAIAAGIKTRGREEYGRMHPHDHSFFSQIDSEEKAYWLGFLAADGNVAAGNCISLGLSEVDLGHVAKFRAAIGSSKTIRIRPAVVNGKYVSKPSAWLVMKDKRMAADLARHGVVPRKSLILEPPQTVPERLMRHYWRGVVDGDGCISSKERRSRKEWQLSAVGSRAMMHGLLEFLRPSCNTNAAIRSVGNVWTMAIGGNVAAVAAMRALYDGATLYLDRKYKLFQEALKPIPTNRTLYDFRGKSYSVAGLAKMAGIGRLTMLWRLAHGWTPREAVMRPVLVKALNDAARTARKTSQMRVYRAQKKARSEPAGTA